MVSLAEQIKLRPDTYVGSVRREHCWGWAYDATQKKFAWRKVLECKGLLTIFDEPLVNAFDHFQRCPDTMRKIAVTYDRASGAVTVRNDGNGIPVERHEDHPDLWVPTMCFGRLLTSDNYDDEEQRIGGGRNGFGAKLTNLFSKSFEVETVYVDPQNGGGKTFRQRWESNMSEEQKVSVRSTSRKSGYTEVRFQPDYARFGSEDGRPWPDVEHLLFRRVCELAATTPRQIKVTWNGDKTPCQDLLSYAKMYPFEEPGAPTQVSLNANGRWTAVVMPPPVVPEDAEELPTLAPSFVNGIRCEDGTHVAQVTNPLVRHLASNFKRVSLRRGHLATHVWVLVNSFVVNPEFTSQTKDCLKSKKLGSKPAWEAKQLTKVARRSGVMDRLTLWATAKESTNLATASAGARGVRGVPDSTTRTTRAGPSRASARSSSRRGSPRRPSPSPGCPSSVASGTACSRCAGCHLT